MEKPPFEVTIAWPIDRLQHHFLWCLCERLVGWFVAFEGWDFFRPCNSVLRHWYLPRTWGGEARDSGPEKRLSSHLRSPVKTIGRYLYKYNQPHNDNK